MPNVFMSSDHHFWHGPINDYSDRPFRDNDHAAAEMVRRHNKVVDPAATVFFVGDVWFGPRDDGRMREVISSMKGEKILVAGNHDRCSVTQTNGWRHQREYLDAGFAAVVDTATLTLPQVKGGAQARKVLVSHFPYRADHTEKARYTQFRPKDEGLWLIHGHVHDAYTVRDRGVNVGVDVWDFTPVNVHDIARLISAVESGERQEF